MSEAGLKKNILSIFFQYRDVVFQLSFEVPFTFNASTLTRALSIKYKSKEIKNSFQLCKRYLSRLADGRTQRHLRFSRISSAPNENVELFCHRGVYSVSISIRNPHVASNKSDCSVLLIVRFSNISYGDRLEGLKQ